MHLLVPVVAAVAAAACGWPASALVVALGEPAPAAVADAAAADAAASTTAIRRPRPIAALLTSLVLAALAVGIAIRVHPAAVAAAGCWVAVCGEPLAIIDARHRRLPDALTGAALLARRSASAPPRRVPATGLPSAGPRSARSSSGRSSRCSRSPGPGRPASAMPSSGSARADWLRGSAGPYCCRRCSWRSSWPPATAAG